MELRPPPACGVMMRTLRFENADALARALCDALTAALAQPGLVMLAGGSTPLAAYRLLAEGRPQIHPAARLFFSDDRHVPPDHPKSNFQNIAPLLRAAGVPDARIVRVLGEHPLQEAVAAYARELERIFAHGAHAQLGLLGLGADGHTASLFSEAHIAEAKGKWAIGVHRPDGLDGVSATPEVFKRIERIIVATTGAEKKPMAERLVRDPRSIPAGLALRGHRGVELWCDAAAWPIG